MKSVAAGVFGLLVLSLSSQAQILTIRVGPAPLVSHDDLWRYRKGTNQPQGDWKTIAESGLDNSWQTGPGGFGYGDGDDATALDDMLDRYNTVYIRRSFNVPDPFAPGQRLLLIMDWDDGFVAYLDGAELKRSPNVAVANPVFDSQTVLGQNHEASAGANGNPPTTYDIGPAETWLTPGPHVLAVHGLNSDLASTDFSLIADLLVAGAGTVTSGALFALVANDEVQLTGTNTVPGATRVFVNGEGTLFNALTGEWSRRHTVVPGLNRLFVAAVDPTGRLLGSVERDVVYETASRSAGGVLGASASWAGGTVRVTNTVIVPAGVTLDIAPGTVVLLASGTSIRATGNGVVQAAGTDAQPILFAPADGATPWGELSANGSGASLTLRHAEVVAGQVRLFTNATAVVEDSLLRDLHTRQLSDANHGGQFTFRRCHWNRFAQTHFDFTSVLIEDCLIENVTSDATDFEGAPATIMIRRSTYRSGVGSNTDAVDTGNNLGLTVESCLIRGFPDKAVSIADRSDGTIVRHSLILNCGNGVSAYASSNCLVYGNTISGCGTGMFLRANAGIAAEVFGTNNIVWGNGRGIDVLNDASLQLAYCDVQGGYPGVGNLDTDPQFVDPAREDFRLRAGSPAIGTALGGGNLGVAFPVGGLPGSPRDLEATVQGTNEIVLRWGDAADNETGVEVHRSMDGTNWLVLTTVASGVTTHTDGSAALFQRYYYRVRAVNGAGPSRYSNLASATRQEPAALSVIDGGTLISDMTWTPAMGTILVLGSVVVPTNVTLTVQAGTTVQVTNNASIRALAGGSIRIEGTADHQVRLLPAEPGALWGDLSARFAGASLRMSHAEVLGAQTTIYSNAVGVLEDCYFHDYVRAGASILIAPILMTHFAAPTVIRRCHVRAYHETLFRNGILTIEECLFENVRGDGLDLDSAQPGTVVRRCTFRHGTLDNVDALDVGPGTLPGDLPRCYGVRIEDCVMLDFRSDKGVSVGDDGKSHGIVVSNCFISGCLSGVMVKDLCEVSVRQCTIVSNRWGFTNYNKLDPDAATGGGILTNVYNNVLWNNEITLSMWNDSRLYADHNDFGRTNWAAGGSFANIDADPLFEDATGGDYRLGPGSPCRGAGRDGSDLGATFPVGAPMAPSHPSIKSLSIVAGGVVVRFWADHEKTYSLLCSEGLAGSPWTKVVDVPTGGVPRFLSVTNTISSGNRFYRLASPAL